MSISSDAVLAVWWRGHEGWGPGTWFVLIPVIWILVIGLLLWCFRGRGWWQRWDEPHRLSAREILDRRFAEGAIDEEEYDRRRQHLSSDR